MIICSIIVQVELLVSVGYRFVPALPKREQLQLDFLSNPVAMFMSEAPITLSRRKVDRIQGSSIICHHPNRVGFLNIH